LLVGNDRAAADKLVQDSVLLPRSRKLQARTNVIAYEFNEYDFKREKKDKP
jgi:hypothetical protein